MPLTNLLYDCDHAVASLILSFVTAKTIEEPIFWCNELLDSGFIQETFNALWTAFYSTAAIDYPHISDYITTKTMLWVENQSERKHILHIVTKLFVCRRSSHTLNHFAHHTHPSVKLELSTILRGKGPAWLTEYDPASHLVIRHIHRKSPEKAISIVCRSENIQFLNATAIACDNYLGAPCATPSFPSNINLAKLHIISSILRKKIHNIPNDSPFNTFNTPHGCEYKPREEAARNALCGPFENNIDIKPPNYNENKLKLNNYNILRNLRKFSHNPASNIFTNNKPPSIQDIRENWLNLCSGCPTWEYKIKKYGGIINENGNVTFKDEESFEQFHNKFDLEFDEQPSWVQQMNE